MSDNKGARIIQFPKIHDPRGNLTFIEGKNHIPFDVKRSFWIYDVPGGEVRGGHAYREGQEVIIALSGSFDVLVDYGDWTQIYNLNRSYLGLYIPNLTWRQMIHFSTNSVALVLASSDYLADDYVHRYAEYLELKKNDSA
ncbi:FdtA/QdtA family cupin domain-containing protein [Acidobacteriota bacterium]